MPSKKYARVDQRSCVSCGSCEKLCPRDAIRVWKGCYAKVEAESCIGCGICVRACPADCIETVPWSFAYTDGSVPAWVAQFSFGFYGLMLTSALIGIIVMALYKPRSWCTFCPMGTLTQGICKLKAEH